MLTNFFYCLKSFGVPVTIREHLDLLAAIRAGVTFADQEEFYYLARTVLVKDEKHFDKFDKAIAAFMSGLDSIEGLIEALIPDDWLRSEFIKQLSEEDKAKMDSLGGLDELIEQFKKRLEEQKKRHAGGSKWIGTGGTSPFGHGGFHPSGIRVGGEGQHNRAVKVWEKREFRNLDDSTELGRRNVKLALRRLRKFAREGAADQLDLEDTIHSTARNAGLLDIKMVPEKRNAVKVLIFFDVGGSMNSHVEICEQLFSAARLEFKHLEYFYFHNFIYESVWKDNHRRHNERFPIQDIFNKYGRDYKVIFVGDASMSPWELAYPGGSVEHNNAESGEVWMGRVMEAYDHVAWLNPVEQRYWDYTQSIGIVREYLEDKMFPLTLKGLEQATKWLAH
ncbi:MAG: VWA domain-containing protein [Gammaproteobacteria bacterium]|nr:VWA domain-containing protein [Gammaproteobacteria bacterium]